MDGNSDGYVSALRERQSQGIGFSGGSRYKLLKVIKSYIQCCNSTQSFAMQLGAYL